MKKMKNGTKNPSTKFTPKARFHVEVMCSKLSRVKKTEPFCFFIKTTCMRGWICLNPSFSRHTETPLLLGLVSQDEIDVINAPILSQTSTNKKENMLCQKVDLPRKGLCHHVQAHKTSVPVVVTFGIHKKWREVFAWQIGFIHAFLQSHGQSTF